MNPEMRHRSAVRRPAILAALGFLPLGLATALAQTAPRAAGEVPYLNFPPVQVPGNTAPNPPQGAAPELRPSTNPVPSPPASGLDTLKQRDQELATIRADQKRAVETETRLRREIESIGDDRRQLNQQLIETANRVRTVEDEIAKTEERLVPLDDRERLLRQSLDARQGVVVEVLAALQR